MNTHEPDSGMTAEELEWLRDQLQASIEHARGVLRRTELLLLAAQLSGRSARKQSQEQAAPQAEPGSLRAGTTDK
jgi:DNA polymerase III delta prime subunit